MEVHPPDHAIHTWREFLTHMATICLGLLIAIGLEQSVEAVHHRHQHAELLDGLRADGELISHDSRNADHVLSERLDWLGARAIQVQTALDQHQPVALPAPNPVFNWDYPTDPAWSAARSSGLISLFSQQDIKAYSELEECIDNVHTSYNQYDAARRQRVMFERSFSHEGITAGQALSTAAPEDLRHYADLLRNEAGLLARLHSFIRQVIGADDAIQHGERSLERIDAEEDRLDVPE